MKAFHPMKALSTLTAAIIIGGIILRPAAAGDQLSLSIRSSTDTLQYSMGDVSGSVLLADLDKFDTTVIRSRAPLVLISPIDTLVITYSPQPVTAWIVSSSDTIYETIIFKKPVDEVLRDYAAFGNTRPPDMDNFSYALPSESLLTELRTTYNLDSVAGDGSEIQRIINFMHWAHTIVRHDGNSTNPEPRNALNLIRVCREENRGVNCRMIATILNEAYLAMGFNSRFVTCLPEDKTDTDCHVTNMVFSKTLDKWVYMDPTFQGYFMDEDSVLLNHMEIRQRLIEGRPLLLPDDLNWNGTPYDHDQYRNYMTKNLFRFSCPVGSEPGYESKESDLAWIHLNPAGYDDDKVGSADTTGVPGALRVDYYTNDAGFFWAKP